MPEDGLVTTPNLREAIIKTIAFFDLFDSPLTVYEIYSYLGKNGALNDILKTAEEESGLPDGLIKQKDGLYFLTGREQITITRQKRFNYVRRKVKIAKRFSRLFRLCPFVKMIAVANVIGPHNLRDESDIDFFIITSGRRLWLTRLYCTGLAALLSSRPTVKNKRDKICLSFYVSENALNLDSLTLKDGDPYFDYWRRSLVLLYNKKKTYQRFLKENSLTSEREKEKSNLLKRCPSFSFFDLLENLSKKFQLKIMPPVLKSAANNSDGVIISDAMLKLYLGDRRREYAEKYGNKINEVFKKND